MQAGQINSSPHLGFVLLRCVVADWALSHSHMLTTPLLDSQEHQSAFQLFLMDGSLGPTYSGKKCTSERSDGVLSYIPIFFFIVVFPRTGNVVHATQPLGLICPPNHT